MYECVYACVCAKARRRGEFRLWIVLRDPCWGINHLRLSVLAFLLLFIHFNFVAYLGNSLGTNTWPVACHTMPCHAALVKSSQQTKLATRKSRIILIFVMGRRGQPASLLCATLPHSQSYQEIRTSQDGSNRNKKWETFVSAFFLYMYLSLVRACGPEHCWACQANNFLFWFACSASLPLSFTSHSHHNKHHNVLRDTSVRCYYYYCLRWHGSQLLLYGVRCALCVCVFANGISPARGSLTLMHIYLWCG